MSGNSVVLDTNIVLYLLSGDEVLSDLFYQKKLYLSFISQLELLGFKGITDKQHSEISRFIRDCVVILTASFLLPLVTWAFPSLLQILHLK
ncbi:MAG: hypothetical protein HY015_07040 [Bacteroidetes bacterium]|nr:hypothetical protein [Bacteroidota bacterium]MBI3482719.1 hypothetical protein [Bacteroidota bacterium]